MIIHNNSTITFNDNKCADRHIYFTNSENGLLALDTELRKENSEVYKTVFPNGDRFLSIRRYYLDENDFK